jgi:hypothetical protein
MRQDSRARPLDAAGAHSPRPSIKAATDRRRPRKPAQNGQAINEGERRSRSLFAHLFRTEASEAEPSGWGRRCGASAPLGARRIGRGGMCNDIAMVGADEHTRRRRRGVEEEDAFGFASARIFRLPWFPHDFSLSGCGNRPSWAPEIIASGASRMLPQGDSRNALRALAGGLSGFQARSGRVAPLEKWPIDQNRPRKL